MHNKKALIIGYGRMGRIYFEILSELGFKSIDIIEKNKLKIDNKKDFKSKKLEFIALVMLMLKKKIISLSLFQIQLIKNLNS